MRFMILLVGLTVTALRPTPWQQAPAPEALLRFLRQGVRLDSSQIAAALRGDVVVKVLDTENKRDVAIFGITTSDISRETFDRQARDFQNSLRAPTRAHFGVFSTPAIAADVAEVTITKRDAEDMKDCKPGDCAVKLPAVDMRRIREETDWSSKDLAGQMTTYARRRLVEYVNDYRARGESAMAIYDDRTTPNVRSSEAFRDLLAASPYVYQNVPSLRDYLSSYPRGTLPAGATEVLFWSEDVMPRLRPILSVTHQVVYTPPELPGNTIVAAKQIYANHYFEATVDITLVTERPAGSYVMVLRRYRFDNLPSGGLLNIRGRAIGALRDQLSADLKRQKAARP
jgi:hypothetical protein